MADDAFKFLRDLEDSLACNAIQKALRPAGAELMDVTSSLRAAMTNNITAARFVLPMDGLRKAMEPPAGLRAMDAAVRSASAALASKAALPDLAAIHQMIAPPSCMSEIVKATGFARGLIAGAAIQQVALGAHMEGLMGVRRFGTITGIDGEEPFDDESVDALELPEEHRETLLRVDRLPLAVLRQVLGDPRHMLRLSPREFEYFVADLLERLGFADVMVTPQSGDGGRDVVARKIVDRIPLVFMFECKHYAPDKKVRLDTIRALLGAASMRSANVNKAVLVTTSTFTPGGWDLIASEAILEGKDYDGIVEWIRDCAPTRP